jgi:hypothetical protein
MDGLDDIKRKADSWYEFMLSEADKAVQKALEDAAKALGQQKDSSQ